MSVEAIHKDHEKRIAYSKRETAANLRDYFANKVAERAIKVLSQGAPIHTMEYFVNEYRTAVSNYEQRHYEYMQLLKGALHEPETSV